MRATNDCYDTEYVCFVFGHLCGIDIRGGVYLLSVYYVCLCVYWLERDQRDAVV